MKIKTALYYLVKTVNTALTVVLVLYCLFFGYIFFCNSIAKMEVPQLGPVRMYVVLSDSMAPHFMVDDAVFVVETDPKELKVNDVIAFTAFETNAAVTHRVISIEETDGVLLFGTKGDNNKGADIFTTPESRIIGKTVYKITGFGGYINTIKKTPLIIILPMFLLIVFQFLLNYLQNEFKPNKETKAIKDKLNINEKKVEVN